MLVLLGCDQLGSKRRGLVEINVSGILVLRLCDAG
jgi:hypothetical protein